MPCFRADFFAADGLSFLPDSFFVSDSFLHATFSMPPHFEPLIPSITTFQLRRH
jgi:hypothetical protein